MSQSVYCKPSLFILDNDPELSSALTYSCMASAVDPRGMFGKTFLMPINGPFRKSILDGVKTSQGVLTAKKLKACIINKYIPNLASFASSGTDEELLNNLNQVVEIKNVSPKEVTLKNGAKITPSKYKTTETSKSAIYMLEGEMPIDGTEVKRTPFIRKSDRDSKGKTGSSYSTDESYYFGGYHGGKKKADGCTCGCDGDCIACSVCHPKSGGYDDDSFNDDTEKVGGYVGQKVTPQKFLDVMLNNVLGESKSHRDGFLLSTAAILEYLERNYPKYYSLAASKTSNNPLSGAAILYCLPNDIVGSFTQTKATDYTSEYTEAMKIVAKAINHAKTKFPKLQEKRRIQDMVVKSRGWKNVNLIIHSAYRNLYEKNIIAIPKIETKKSLDFSSESDEIIATDVFDAETFKLISEVGYRRYIVADELMGILGVQYMEARRYQTADEHELKRFIDVARMYYTSDDLKPVYVREGDVGDYQVLLICVVFLCCENFLGGGGFAGSESWSTTTALVPNNTQQLFQTYASQLSNLMLQI